ncbi:anaerobic ribonucleoside-triphosphate reductase activating protein [Caldichromatium japonicum]|uniref:Anaerobic ribonucleoside-triphosphate reductase activating protein n=1 Tax=Caldichromatium japonicum TaxID=2699430 RepID=A0A6G7VF76_9GAMM|nr:anaerobic ribonucleoside-triphosphate reductase activating protein [Caldichromatium japonicum]QIK38508.1 anaerobic ribonucleoside-triphosphate reductase activating protein [Caldichromatium japonicum]
MPDGACPATRPTAPTAEALRVGGLVPLTTLDYPGELAAVVFCQGCPWWCRYCHNGHLLEATERPPFTWARIEGFLRQRQGLLDAVVFSGGEPTAQTALTAALQAVRALGYKIGLHTSGAYPEHLPAILPFIDWVGLDIKALPEDYPAITRVPASGQRAWETLEILVGAGVDLEVRTTLMPNWTPDYVRCLSERLADAGVRHYALQVCTLAHALDPSLPLYSTPPQTLASAVDPNCFARLEVRGL